MAHVGSRASPALPGCGASVVDNELDLRRLRHMASLFAHSRLKLWMWIVIIAAGSMILLCLPVLGWWCCVRRQRAKKKSLPSPILAATRKVTIRRGRMVSSSRYLSLTGSKFGLGQFLNVEEKDQGERSRSRSKSPFTWWLSTMQDRSQSRQSHMSSQRQMHEAYSHCYQKPEPAFHNHHARKESTTSNYSLPSIINGRELAEDARVNPLRAAESPSGPHSPKHVNFSRAFSPLHQSTLRSTSTPNVLSQIVESSPRHSTVSKPPSLISASEVVSRHQGAINAKEVVRDEVSASMPYPTTPLRTLQASRSVPDHLLQNVSGPNMRSRFSFATNTSVSLYSDDAPRTPFVFSTSHLPANPRSGPFPQARPYGQEKIPVSPPVPSLSQMSVPSTVLSVSDKQALREKTQVENRPAEAPDEDAADPQALAYWRSRPDLQPVRQTSKKGNVLRKKSIRRAEIAS